MIFKDEQQCNSRRLFCDEDRAVQTPWFSVMPVGMVKQKRRLSCGFGF